MKWKVPNSKTMLAFLKSKGWTLKEQTDMHYIMSPPSHYKITPSDFCYRLPAVEEAIDYHTYALAQVFSIAQFYDLDKMDLLDLLSRPFDEIQKDVEMKREFFRKAS